MSKQVMLQCRHHHAFASPGKLLSVNSHGSVVQNRTKTNKPIPEFGKTTYVYKNLPDREKHPEFEENEYLPRRISYWPPDLGQYRKAQKFPFPWSKIQKFISLEPLKEEVKPEWLDKPQYPEITDYVAGDVKCKMMFERRKWYDKIRTIPTVEEKMLECSDHTRVEAIRLQAYSFLYNTLHITQNITKTSIRKGLPEIYNEMTVDPVLKSRVVNGVLDAVGHANLLLNDPDPGRMAYPRMQASVDVMKEFHFGQNSVLDAINVALKACTPLADHLLDSQVDINPNIESWWYLGGLELPSSKPKFSSNKYYFPESNTTFQFSDAGVLNIRTKDPLTPSQALNESSIREITYEPSKLSPYKAGYPMKWTRKSSLAGYWYNKETETHEFPFLSIYPRNVLTLREYQTQEMFDDEDVAVEGMGILYNFAWLNSLAMYHGFTPYDELTYPFTTQSVVTDGRIWNFFVYQLNSHAFHGDLQFNRCNHLQNICWSSGPMKLFEDVNSDGSVNGVNEEVIELLLKFLMRKPTPLSPEVQLKPYLGVDERSEEIKKKQAFRLMRLFGQKMSHHEHIATSLARVNPWHRIYGYYNKHAPSIAHWRKEPRYIKENFKLNRNKFTT
jgi:small subunit ribosomal protein S30